MAVGITPEKPNKKRSLGRGLGSLLSDNKTTESESSTLKNKSNDAKDSVNNSESLAKAATDLAAAKQQAMDSIPEDARIWKIAIEKIKPNPNQPRRHFDAQKLKELSLSIKEHGILQPLVAEKISASEYKIVAGERRWRAAQMAGLHEVPVVLRTVDTQKNLELALIENIQRHDLNPVEEAEAYNRLVKDFNLTQQQVADRVGKERATVANTLRLLNLVPEVRQMLIESKISLGHAKALLTLTDPIKQVEVAKQIAQQTLTVRDTENLINREKKQAGAEKSATPEGSKEEVRKSLHIKSIATDLQKCLGTRVQIDYNDGKGKLAIYFYSNDELTHLSEGLRKYGKNNTN